MKILVSNIGSTSFKFRLFDMGDGAEREIASGGADRIGKADGELIMKIGDGDNTSQARDFADHGEAIRFILDALVAGDALESTDKLDAVAFKAVMAGDAPAVALVDEKLLKKMEFFNPVTPAHNPPCIAAMRMFARVLDGVPLVAAFEPGFHRTNPRRRRMYAVPPKWASEYGIKRYGYHGASHRYVATRIVELMPDAGRIVSCHLGGSSSLCAIRDGRSQATSMGLSCQSGLPQGARVGDFDPFGLAMLTSKAGIDAEEALEILGNQSGLAAMSKTSGDMRDIEQAAQAGDQDAQLALEVYVTAVRDYLGAYLVELGGADAIAFTGGIGQNSPLVRSMACEGMDFAGVVLDDEKNASAEADCRIDADSSATAIWVVATNEELIVARQALELLES